MLLLATSAAAPPATATATTMGFENWGKIFDFGVSCVPCSWGKVFSFGVR